MDDTIGSHQTPADEDPLIHRLLGGLPAYGPASAHFEDRVLASVRRPSPEWVRQLGERYRELAASGWPRKAVGILAIGGLVPTTAVVVAAIVFHAEIAWGVRWFLGTGVPIAWEHTATEASHAATVVQSALRSVLPDALVSTRGAVILAGGLAGCAVGLTRTMKAKKAVTS